MQNYQHLQNLLNRPYQSGLFKKQILVGIFRPRVKNFELLSDDTLEHQELTSGEREIAKAVYRYGSLITADDKRIDLYEIVLRENRIIERNKVAVGSLVKNRIIGNNAVFASFVYPDGSNQAWRFSFIARDSVLEEGEIKQVETNPKRYTYIFGPGESCRTAAERFYKLSENSHINLKDIQEAFSVEKVSKQFFKEYKEHYLQFVEYLNASNFKTSVFNGDEKAIRDFSKKLLGRIVFLYFLQKKGWLGVPLNGNWGQGDPDFLRNLFKQSGANETFYATILTRLFFDTLNTERQDDLCELIEGRPCRIPYLNGGLFEKESDKYGFLTFPRELFFELFEFFNRYNFTIYEDSPEEHTMAVDPEMLGHIFENLLEDNKDKGAYYTPKEIVHYMTQESLIEYLFTQLNTEHVDLAPNKKTADLFIKHEQAGLSFDEQKDNISREDIERFIKQKEPTGYIVKNAVKIARLLDKVKICDPAIGSGAFPMGLLHEIYSAKQVLHNCLPPAGGSPEWNPPKVKESIIQNSIYGVDIEKGAVDIARLRFWLSLIVDEDKPRPLPNLDYKIVVGNSLVPRFEDEVIEIDWDLKSSVGRADKVVQKIQTLLKQIVQNQKAYFKPGGNKQAQKKEIRDLKINLLIHQLTLNKIRYRARNAFSSSFHPSAKDRQKDVEIKMTVAGFDRTISRLKSLLGNDKPFAHFDWKLDFPDVMNENVAKIVGFDIVIGNPPYVRQEHIKELKPQLRDQYESYTGVADLYVYFYERGFKLLNNNGTLTYISSNKYFRAGYGNKLRSLLGKRANICQIIDFGDAPVFDATAYPSIIVMRNTTTIKSPIRVLNWQQGFPISGFEKIYRQQSFTLSQKELTPDGWRLEKPEVLRLLKKLRDNGTPLGEYVQGRFYRGVLTGLNKAFVVDRATRDRLIAEHPSSADIIRPFLRGRDIKRWRVEFAEQYLIFTRRGIDIEKYPSIKKHLLQYKSRLMPGVKGGRKPGTYKWYEIQDNIAYWQEFEQPKIIYPNIWKRNKFTWDEKQFYTNQKTFIIPAANKTLLAILNSKTATWLFSHLLSKLQNGYFEPSALFMKKFPLPKNLDNQQLDEIAQQVLVLKEQDPRTDIHDLENKIDLIVHKLYQLTYDEVLVVDPSFPLSKEEYENFEIESEI